MFAPDQSIMIEQAKFTYSSLGEASGKQIKTQSFSNWRKVGLTLNDLYDTNCMIRLVGLCKIANSY